MESTQDRKKVFFIDYPQRKTTRHWLDYLKSKHDVITDLYFNPIAAEWADVIWVEWCETPAVEATQLKGRFEDSYDHEGLRGEKDKQYSGDFDWSGKPIYVRGIDMDIFYGAYRKVRWENVSGFFYIAPHLLEVMDDIPYPDGLKRHLVTLGVKLDAWDEVPERGEAGRKIAWVNHNWTAKGLPLALFALRKLIDVTNDKRWELHIVECGKSNEFWFHRYIKHQVRSLGLEEHVRFYPKVADVNLFLNDFDYLWHTSMKEAFSLIIGEGLAKCLKVLTMDWESSRYLWGNDIVCRTVDELVDKTRSYPLSHDARRGLAATHSHATEIAVLSEITGL